MQRVTIKAFAKINLTLDVLGKRPDGYHEVIMIMQGISVYDFIDIKKTECLGIELHCDAVDLETGPSNLAYQAAMLLAKDFPQIKGVEIDLKKGIPIAAGLGGGSSDGAAVLIAMNELFDLELSLEELRNYGAQLGSDVPFCLQPLTALAKGRGEQIEELSTPHTLWMVLAKPPFGVSTKKVYDHLNHVKILERPDIKAAIDALKEQNVHKLNRTMANVLEYATYDLYPELKKWANEIFNLGAMKVMMSGSGPTLIAFCDSEENALKIASLWVKPDWKIFVTRTLNEGDLNGRVEFYE